MKKLTGCILPSIKSIEVDLWNRKPYNVLTWLVVSLTKVHRRRPSDTL